MTVFLGVLSLGAAASPSTREVRCSLYEFVRYYQALGKSDAQAGFWEKVAVSLALASDHPSSRAAGRPQPAPRQM